MATAVQFSASQVSYREDHHFVSRPPLQVKLMNEFGGIGRVVSESKVFVGDISFIAQTFQGFIGGRTGRAFGDQTIELSLAPSESVLLVAGQKYTLLIGAEKLDFVIVASGDAVVISSLC